MGVPWRRPEPGLCSFKLQSAEAEEARNSCLLPSPELVMRRAPGAQAEEARNFCLLPSPELGMRRPPNVQGQSPPLTPSSPGAMQRRFLERVRRASLGGTPGSGEFAGGDGPFTPMGDTSGAPCLAFLSAPAPPLPEHCRRSQGDSLASTAPSARCCDRERDSTDSDHSAAEAAPAVVGNRGGGGGGRWEGSAELHAAPGARESAQQRRRRREEQERLQLGACRAKPRTSKAVRRLSMGPAAVKHQHMKPQRQQPGCRTPVCAGPTAFGAVSSVCARSMRRVRRADGL